MDELIDTPMLTFDAPIEQSSYIKVIGVGGGGGNAVNHMYEEGINGVDFIICNTDMKALSTSPVSHRIVLGNLGAGNVPERARRAALEHKDEIREAISHNTQMLFITAGMGGGTGTGAAPVIAEIAKSIELDDEDVKHILVVGVVTMPFSWEGRRRMKQAEAGVAQLREHVDSLIIINNDKLATFRNMKIEEAFRKANDVLFTAVKGIAEIITVNAYVNIDFRDVNTVMENSGTALMGTGVGHGESRALDAIRSATESTLLNDQNIKGSKNVLLYFSFAPSESITMEEICEVTDFLLDITGGEADVIWGEGSDESITEDELKITLIATGFQKNDTTKEGKIITVDKDGVPQETSVNKIDSTPAPVAPIDAMKDTAPASAPESQEAPKSEVDARRVFSLEDNPVEKSVEAAAAPQLVQEAPVEDDIRVVTRTPEAVSQQVRQVAHQQVATMEDTPVEIRVESSRQSTLQQTTTVPQPVYSEAEVETQVVDAMPTPVPQAAATPTPTPTYSPIPEMPQGNAAFGDGSGCMSKNDRIKAINELLHSHKDGPDMVAAIPVSQLDGDIDIDVTPHSDKTAIVGKMISKDGDMRNLNSFLFPSVD